MNKIVQIEFSQPAPNGLAQIVALGDNGQLWTAKISTLNGELYGQWAQIPVPPGFKAA
jgi:hypothetical protein